MEQAIGNYESLIEPIIKMHSVFKGMKLRVYSCNHRTYKYYGGRGIKICDEWLQDEKAFIKWGIENGYEKGLQIDRIDVNGDYKPSNCRWVTSSHNQINKRPLNNKTGFTGVTFNYTSQRFTTRIRVEGKRIHLGSYETAVKAAKAYDEYIIKNNLDQPLNF